MMQEMALTHNEVLERLRNAGDTLELGCEKISDEGCKALAEGLKGNQTLTSLSLRSIGALDVGLEALAKALQCNGSIKELDICGNHPGPVAVEALIKMLEENDSLLDVNSGLFDNERQYSNIFRPRPAMSEELAERYRKFQCIAEKRTLQNKVLRHVTVPLLLSNSVYLGGSLIPQDLMQHVTNDYLCSKGALQDRL
mmetsp:Transcript_23112/g.44945  ORF Transcript_23112/g.44945 Transcript_23112/m.44945 type:complete len:197 (+) Transcript_23112:766-1356(+)